MNRIVYQSLLLPLLLALARLAALVNEKVRRSLEARAGVLDRLESAATRRDRARPPSSR